MPLDALLSAIVENDQTVVKKLLAGDPTLVALRVTKPKLHHHKIFHWLYVGNTALHLAAAGHRTEIVRLLLAAGADPNAATNHRRSTPLHYAADGNVTLPEWNPENQVKTLQILLKSGAQINAQDKNGATPLHRAVRTRCADAVKFLLQSGADATIKNKPGSTPFHLAVQNTGRGGSGTDVAIAQQRQIIQEVLAFGISPNLKTAAGKTVLASAKSDWIRKALSNSV